ncbi:MAG TPA: hypothetical protein VLX90_14095 [Steroidobacteraceae bacterium]|nr:hypothetical protein [Steroidobacteraceae bacterium]
MRWAWLVAAACAAVIAVPGCKSRQRDPIPGPQVGVAAHHHVGGIAWFQGNLEEAFSLVREGSKTGGAQPPGPRWAPPCLGKAKG